MGKSVTARKDPGHYYRCPNCKNELLLHQVRRIDPIVGWFRIRIRYECPCSEGGARNMGTDENMYALERLFGSEEYSLPWVNPLHFKRVPENDPLLKRWHWEIAKVRSADEFVEKVDEARAP